MAENTDQTKDQAAPAEGEAKQGDGGDVVLVNCTDDGVVTLEMQGACAGCPLSSYDMSEGIERILKEHVPGVTKVEPAMAW